MSQNPQIFRDALRVMLLRELRALNRQIAAYPDDRSIWEAAPGIANSAGNLVLHIAGNLRHFVGAVLGDSGYVRNRDAEFSTRGFSREELRAEIQATIADVDGKLDALDDSRMELAYPLPIGERRVRTAEFLVHLAVHLGYHLGQVDYHRRILTGSPQTVDTMSIRELTRFEERL